jgi:hypothetical protein
MWFRKNNMPSKVEAEVQEQQRLLEEFRSRMDAAKACPDAAESLVMLKDLRSSLITAGWETRNKEFLVGDDVAKPYRLASLASAAGTFTLAIAAAAVPVFILPAMLFSAVAFWVAGCRKGRMAGMEIQMVSAPFLKTIDALQDEAGTIAHSLITSDIGRIARSPKFKEALERAPELRMQFMLALAKQVTSQRPDAPEPQPGGRFNL